MRSGLPVAVAIVLAHLGSTSAQTADWSPNLFFNYTITHLDAVVNWAEYDSPGKPTWSANKQERWTSGSYSGFQLDFVGTLVNVYGSVQGAAGNMKATLDRATVNIAQQSPIINSSEMAWGRHSLDLQTGQSSNSRLSITEMMITTGIKADVSRMSEVKTSTAPFVVSGQNNGDFKYTGGFSIANTIQEGYNNLASSQRGLVGGKGSAVTVPIPPNTAYLQLFGSVGPSMDSIQIDFGADGPPPTPFDSRTIPITTKMPVAANALLYMTALNPAHAYTMTISSGVDATYRLDRLVFHSGVSKGKSGGKKTNVGAIAGGVVGGVVALLALGALIFFCCRKRKRKPESTQSEEGFTIDDEHVKFEAPVAINADPSATVGYQRHDMIPLLPNAKAREIAAERHAVADSTALNPAPMSYGQQYDGPSDIPAYQEVDSGRSNPRYSVDPPSTAARYSVGAGSSDPHQKYHYDDAVMQPLSHDDARPHRWVVHDEDAGPAPQPGSSEKKSTM